MARSVHVAYFDRFPSFEPDLQTSFITDFHRLAELQGWKHKRYRTERSRCVLECYDAYLGNVERGGRQERLLEFQRLCRELLVEPVPRTLTQCRKVNSIGMSEI